MGVKAWLLRCFQLSFRLAAPRGCGGAAATKKNNVGGGVHKAGKRGMGGGDQDCRVDDWVDCDYKGWMPQSVLDIAMPIAQTQFIECLKKLAQKLKDEGKF